MQRMLGTAVGAFALLLAAAVSPFASAEDGTVTAKSPVLFQGATRVESGEGFAAFASPSPGAPASLDVRAAHATVHHYRQEIACRDVAGGLSPCFPVAGAPEDAGDSYEIDDLVLSGSPSQVAPLALQWATGDDARFAADLVGVTELAVDEEGDPYGCDDADTCRSLASSLAEDAAGQWYVANDAWAVDGDGGVHLRILGLNVQVGGLVEGEPFQATYETGEWDRSESPAGSQPAYRVHTVDVLEVVADDADLRFEAVSPGRVYGDLAATAFDTTTFYGASGRFAVGDRTFDLKGEDATVVGELAVEPVAVVEQDGTDALIVMNLVDAGVPVVAPPVDRPFDAAGTAVALGVGGAALAAFGLAWFWPYLKYVGTATVVPMYSRIGREEVLDHGKREEIFALIRDVPGIHAHEISSRAAVGWGTTVYHLKLLETHGLVVGKRTGRYKRFFATAGGAARNVDHYAVLRNTTTAAIARHVLAHPGCIQKDVCAALNIAPSLVTWHMNRLEEVDLVKKVREGRTVRYYAGGSWGGLRMDFAPETVTPTLVDAGAN